MLPVDWCDEMKKMKKTMARTEPSPVVCQLPWEHEVTQCQKPKIQRATIQTKFNSHTPVCAYQHLHYVCSSHKYLPWKIYL